MADGGLPICFRRMVLRDGGHVVHTGFLCFPSGTAVAKTARLGCHRPAMGTLHGLQLLAPLPLSGYGGFPRSRSLVPCLCGLAPRHPFLRKGIRGGMTTGLCLAGLYQIYTGIAQLAGWEPSHHYRYALTGTFFNPGPYAIW